MTITTASELAASVSADGPWLLPAPAPIGVPISGSQQRFPVHRIYCIGRNYEAHAREMAATVALEAPVFFMKPADALVTDGADVAYPQATEDLHHEVELVLALGGGGRDLNPAAAREQIIAYGLGLDLTRRDLQAAAKSRGLPWDVAKGFDQSAPISALRLAKELGHPEQGEISLSVNGQIRQRSDIADMVLPAGAILAALSRLFLLMPGDLVFTGTPAGVAPLLRGDRFEANFPGIEPLTGRIV